jgi:hypothetical protein
VNLLPTLRAQVRRRLLISYRVDPQIAAGLVPAPFRPQLVRGSAVAGVCIIGLQDVRPGWLRPRVGFSSENAAHRVAVEWEQGGRLRSGVYIVERHSSSLIPVLGGGRLFPGVQHRARFDLDEDETRFRVAMDSPTTSFAVDVELADGWTSELFATTDEASRFHEQGAIGWSPRRDGGGAEPIELTSTEWATRPARVHSVRSSVFDALPLGAAVLDNALVMRDLPFVWDAPRLTPERLHAVHPAA